MKKINPIALIVTLLLSQIGYAEVSHKDSIEIPIYNGTIPKGKTIMFLIDCVVDGTKPTNDTSDGTDISDLNKFLGRTIFVTPGTQFYFQGRDFMGHDGLEQKQYTCAPEDVDGSQFINMGEALTDSYRLDVRLFCKDRERTLINSFYSVNPKIELSLMKGSIHINGTGKKISCGGESTAAPEGNQNKRRKSRSRE